MQSSLIEIKESVLMWGQCFRVLGLTAGLTMLLLLPALLCLCTPSWTVDLPPSVKALVGSCVVIPCSFDFPPPDKEVSQFTGIWTDSTSHVIYHPETRKSLVQYQNRTDLLGDLRHKDCSLKIDPVQTGDKGPYRFRIEIAQYTSYSFREKTVSITTSIEPEPVKFSVKGEVLEAESVSAQCSVSHSCPLYPPLVTWTHSGHVQLQHQQTGGATWTTTSTVRFQLRRTDHHKPLRCTVTHKGGQQHSAGTVLEVKCRNVRCICIAESNPPCEVHLLQSDRVLSQTRTETSGLITVLTLETEMGLFTSVSCFANNSVGHMDLLLSLPLHHIYIYIGVGVGASGLILMILIIVLARKCCQKSRDSEPYSQKLNEDHVRTPQYTVPLRKISAAVHPPVDCSNDHTYGNDEMFDPDDDTVYANI
uniref:Ig-like domain-containing protein n=1 Tax=Knipowitschia caucasica TaxID=637954 RepID=A0AAV2MG07_KNICA